MKIKAKPSLPKLKKKSPVSEDDTVLNFEQAEIDTAVTLYLRECGLSRFSLFKHKALYERPWFLVIGPEGAGKTTLFSQSGTEFPVMYPSGDEGYVPEESTQPSIVWWFGYEAVWLDLPGRLFLTEHRTLFRKIINSLHRIRPRCPVNGILVVVPCLDIINGDYETTRELALSQRTTLEQMIKTWGVELPVYLLFSRTDEIEGFSELFSDPNGQWNKRILGAAIEDQNAQQLPRITFNDHFETITASLNDIRLKMLVKEENEQRRSALCRFPIDITAMREKISVFITTLFKQEAYQGRPRFGGFFFTSCKEDSDEQPPPTSEEEENTLLNHPLNPHRKTGRGRRSDTGTKKRFQSLFTRPLLTTVIPRGATGVTATNRRYYRDLFSLIARCTVALIIIITAVVLFTKCFLTVRNEHRTITTMLKTEATPTIEGLRHLEKLDSVYTRYRQYTIDHPPLPMMITRYNIGKTAQQLTDAYAGKLHALLVEPALALIEEEMIRKLRYSDSRYRELKNDLRAYCFCTDQRLKYPGILKEDSLTLLRLHSTITARIILEASAPKYGTGITRLLTRAFYFLEKEKNPDTPLLSASDSLLVARAQERLVELMDNREMYGIIISQEQSGCSELTLKEIDSGTPYCSILHATRRLNEVYTPNLWKKRILPQIKSAKDQQNKIEKWIIGDSFLSPEYASGSHAQIRELIGLYLDDVTTHWRDFIASVAVADMHTPHDAEQVLRKLVNKKSPLKQLVGAFAQWTKEFPVEDSTVSSAGELFKNFTDANAFFDEFLNDYYPEFKRHHESIADSLAASRKRESIAQVFKGDNNDPLVAAYRFLHEELDPFLESESSNCLSLLLTGPVADIRELLTAPLRNEINTVWKKEVYSPFVRKFANTFPFSEGERDAPFIAARAFFHPEQGAFWRTMHTYLPKRLEEKKTEWVIKSTPGMIPLHATSRFSPTLRHAARITENLFDDGGAPQRWTISVTAEKHTYTNAQFIFNNDNSYPFEPGNTVEFTWPQQGKAVNGTIRCTDENGNTGSLSFSGPWSIMKLFNGVCIPIEGQSRFNDLFSVVWYLPLHAYTLPLKAQVTVSGERHPFCSNEFSGFVVPEVVVK